MIRSFHEDALARTIVTFAGIGRVLSIATAVHSSVSVLTKPAGQTSHLVDSVFVVYSCFLVSHCVQISEFGKGENLPFSHTSVQGEETKF